MAVKLMRNMMRQQRPMQWRQEQNQKGSMPLLTITPSTTRLTNCVPTAAHTRCLLSVSGIISPAKESRKGSTALVTRVFGIVNLLEGLWKLNLLSAIPQAKKVRLQRQQYLQNRVELFTNSGSLYSRSSISLMKQKAGTLARMNSNENARGVVFVSVCFITAIFSFIIIDTSLLSFELNHRLTVPGALPYPPCCHSPSATLLARLIIC